MDLDICIQFLDGLNQIYVFLLYASMSIGIGSFQTQLDIQPSDFIFLDKYYLCILHISALYVEFDMRTVNYAKMCSQLDFVSLIVLNNFMKTWTTRIH